MAIFKYMRKLYKIGVIVNGLTKLYLIWIASIPQVSTINS